MKTDRPVDANGAFLYDGVEVEVVREAATLPAVGTKGAVTYMQKSRWPRSWDVIVHAHAGGSYWLDAASVRVTRKRRSNLSDEPRPT